MTVIMLIKDSSSLMILKSLLKGDSVLHQEAGKVEDNVAKDFVSLGADISAVDNKVCHAFIIPSS